MVEILKAALAALGWNSNALAIKASVRRQYTSLMLHGRCTFRGHKAHQVLDVLIHELRIRTKSRPRKMTTAAEKFDEIAHMVPLSRLANAQAEITLAGRPWPSMPRNSGKKT